MKIDLNFQVFCTSVFLPALVPIHSRSLQANNAVILRHAALCCLMMASAPEWTWNNVGGGAVMISDGEHGESIWRKGPVNKLMPLSLWRNVYLQASCERQVPRPLLSGSPSSGHGTVWHVHCLARPTTHPDRRLPCKSRTDCCLCPPGTSAVTEGRTIIPIS